MTGLVDLVDETPGNLTQLRKDLTEAVAGNSDEQTDTTPNLEDSLPAKFKGKSLKDVVDMYSNLESQYGRTANDLGVQRQLTDRLIGLKRDQDLAQNAAPRKRVEIDAAELLDKPTETLDKYHNAQRADLITEAKDAAKREMAAEAIQQRFLQKHSDFDSVARSAEFGQWVNASAARRRVAAMASQNDYGAAEDLMDEFKGRTQQAAKTQEQKDNLQSARNAQLESSGTTGDSASVKKGKVYSRAALIKLRIEDPATYEDETFQAEILRAYSEGRVK